ncbi:hypothetical protein [Flavobacterium sp. MDT1-60]|uniref:hypothetical protein n=1 Tax=Flavobacterium sp. MDT1-60 TaxID=1979344 RepID=UPI001785D371|nr:hypothetical protein [Flavobacterium sp. MDT1-60]QOG04820.1 hypothetical protein IHE43_11770 [Flavobacterium sp. MDT1-60]
MIQNSWKDPVWSKVISAIIISVGAFFISFTYSQLTDLTIKESFLVLWNYKILLGPTIIILILLYLIVSIIKSIRRRKPNNSNKLENIFHKKYSKYVDSENKVTYRFNAYISSYNKFPFISELRVYCNNHNPEALMKPYSGCNRQGCIHLNKGYNETELKQEIETYLLNEWEKMKA